MAHTLPPFIDQTSLFDNKDGVITLHEGNIKEFIDRSPLPVMVMFYASWCGHCIAFSNTYKKFQKEVENWDIYVAAINCANYRNNKICDKYFSISAYPTIYIFECLQSIEDKKQVDYKTLSSSMNVHSMRKAVAGYLAKQDKCKPIIHNSKEFTSQFWGKFKEGLTTFDRLVIVIDDTLDSDFIDSISMDLRICNRIFTTFLNRKQSELVSLFGTFSSKAIIYVDTSMKIETITSDFDNYGLVRSRIFETVKNSCPEISILTHLLYKPEGSPKFYDIKSPKFVEIHMEDIIGGVGMSLRQEIPRQPISDELVPTIKKYIDVIVECVYWPKDQKEFLHSLKGWVTNQGETIHTDDWNAFMNSQRALRVFPIEKNWISCKGFSAYFRGFPCSVWLTFHIATVKCEKPSGDSNLSAIDVLLAMRGYIINFFGCHACREHFKELTRHAEEQVKTGEEAIIYLWNGHNRVNSRLRLDDSADPLAPKVQFPSIELCPDCREVANLSQSEVFISTPGYDIASITWNRGNVLNFLRSHYGPANIRLPEPKTPTKNEDLHDTSEEFAGSLDKGRKRNLVIKYTL